MRTEVWSEVHFESDYLEDQDKNGKMVLKWI
jgi:hypothetical protein